MPISLDIGTLTSYRHSYLDAFACCRCMTPFKMTANVHDVARNTVIHLCRISLLQDKNSYMLSNEILRFLSEIEIDITTGGH